MSKRGKFFVVEARRLIPLIVLLALLVGLTVYDNFFRAEPTVGSPESEADGIAFTTMDWGNLISPTSFTLVADYDEWLRVSQEMGMALPDYPFNAAEEIAVFAVNSEIKGMDVGPGFGEMEVKVLVEPKDNYYHVITVDRFSVDFEDAVWKFVDAEDRVLSRVVPFWQVDSEEDDEEEEEEVVMK